MNAALIVPKVRKKENGRSPIFFELTILYCLPEKVPVSYE